MAKKRFSISLFDKKNARKSLDSLMNEEETKVIGDDINGGWNQYKEPPYDDEEKKKMLRNKPSKS
ncbi:hypothetical protein [Emticicia sp. 17c]|uniref:hypothetical protein n=1 Tax=Emticicia sp. 17c TaxID=3127704 RepID=UPI00301C21D0